jgi:TFIIF-interacting CTD phosphatase-like protein
MTKKYNIILDLDQTLISGECMKSHNPEKYEKSKLIPHKQMENLYVIYERPYLQVFLDYLFQNFNVTVWTAASKDYGLFIIKEIILRGNRKLDYFFHSKHCDVSDKKNGSCKDLNMLFTTWKIPGYDKTNTMIIDDLKEVYKAQPNNCIPVSPFEFTKDNSENDTELLNVMKKLNKLL